MPKKTRNLNIKFGADTTGFSRGVAEMRGELADLNSSLLKNKREQKELENRIKNASKAYRELYDATEGGTKATEEQKREMEKLKGTVDSTTLQLAGLKAEEAELKGKIRNTTKELSDQTDETKKVAQAQNDLKNSMEKVGNVLKKTAELTGTAMVALFTYSAGMAASADDINTLAKQTGLATDEVQKFMYASELIDVDLETLTGSMAKLIKNMNTAKSGTGDAYDAFMALGVSITDNTGVLRNNQEVFDECIEALSKIQDETQRDAYAMSIFGKSAQELNPLILGGTQQLKEFGDELEREGLILDQVQLDKLNEFNDKIDTFKAKMQAQMMLSATDAIDAFDELFEKSDEIINLVATLIEGFAKFTGFVVDHKEAVLALVVAYGVFKTSMSALSIIDSVIKATKTLTTATQAATVAQNAQNAAVNASPYVLLASVLLSAAASFYTYKAAAKEVTEESNELVDVNADLMDAYSKTMANVEKEVVLLKKKGERYEELRSKIERTASEENELLQLAQSLESSYSDQILLIDETTGAYKELGTQIDDIISKLRTEAEMNAIRKALETAFEAKYTFEIEYNEANFQEMEELINSGFVTRRKDGTIYANFELDLNDDGDAKFNEAINDYNYYITQITSLENSIATLSEKYKTLTTEYDSNFKGVTLVSKAEKELADTNRLSSETLQELMSQYPSLNDAVNEYIDGQKTAKDLVKELSRETQKDNENLITVLTQFADTTLVVIEAEKELADTGRLSLDTLNALLVKYPDLQDELNDYIEGKKTATDVINALNVAYQNDVNNNASALQSKLNTDAEYFQKLREMNGSAINELASEYGVDLSNYETYAEAKLAIEKAFLTSKAQNWARYYDAESKRWVGSIKDDTAYVLSLIANGMSEKEARKIAAQRSQDYQDTLAAVEALTNLDLSTDLYNYAKDYIPTLTDTNSKNVGNLSSGEKELSVNELANAALKELVDERIEELNRLNEAEKTAADERIAAIEAEIEARKELSETDDLQKRIDFLKGELKYSMLDDFERAELQRQLDDLLAEQADKEWETAKRAEIEEIRLQQDQTNAEHQALIEQIQAAQNYANSKLTDLQNGYQSASSVVSNNSTQANITIVNSALTEGQVRKIFGDLLGPGLIT